MNSKYIVGEITIMVGEAPPKGIVKNVLWQRPAKNNSKAYELCY